DRETVAVALEQHALVRLHELGGHAQHELAHVAAGRQHARAPVQVDDLRSQLGGPRLLRLARALDAREPLLRRPQLLAVAFALLAGLGTCAGGLVTSLLTGPLDLVA